MSYIFNSTLKRKTPMKKGSALRKTKLNQVGKKGREWQAAWRDLKPKFERAGITRCEVRYPNCTVHSFLTPAHSRKRRNCTTPELLREVIIACQSCHSWLESMPEAKMAERVRHIIAQRPVAI